MRLRIRHETIFEYDGQVHDSHNEVRLQPLDDELQTCLSFQLRTDPAAQVRTRSDYFGNMVHYFSVAPYHRRLAIRVEALVVTETPSSVGPPRERSLRLADLAEFEFCGRAPLVEYLAPSPYVPLAEELQELGNDLAQKAGGEGAGFWDALLTYFQENLTYEPGSTNVRDDALKVLGQRRGVCQDFAHLTIGLARAAGVPARYVSGYVEPTSGESGASHAWAELYLPGPGWVGIDPSGAGPIDEHYIRVAYGRDYADANPIRGTFRGGRRQDLAVAVSVHDVRDQ
jgi:transglutaminase-like putative cysteine protease